MRSSRISRSCGQSEVADPQGRQAGEEEDAQRPGKEAHHLQSPVCSFSAARAHFREISVADSISLVS